MKFNIETVKFGDKFFFEDFEDEVWYVIDTDKSGVCLSRNREYGKGWTMDVPWHEFNDICSRVED